MPTMSPSIQCFITGGIAYAVIWTFILTAMLYGIDCRFFVAVWLVNVFVCLLCACLFIFIIILVCAKL